MNLPEMYLAPLHRGWTDTDLSDVNRIADVCARDLTVAKSLKDRPSIDLASARAKQVATWRAEHETAMPALVAAEEAYTAAVVSLLQAEALHELGALNGSAASALEMNLVAARAAERARRHALPALRTAAVSPLRSLQTFDSRADSRARTKIIAQTRGFIGVLFGAYAQADAVPRATDAGRASDGAHAAWYLIAESYARDELAERLAANEHPTVAGEGWTPPTVADLEQCFAARRASLESARAAARAQMSNLEGKSA
jgi:hypothetical protein